MSNDNVGLNMERLAGGLPIENSLADSFGFTRTFAYIDGLSKFLIP
jgi:hypothetical protein